MVETKIAPYGAWESPIRPEDFAEDSIFIAQLSVNKSNGKIYAVEWRPSEGGRAVIVEYHNGTSTDVLPAQYSARSQVHEYGGVAFTPRENDGHIIFTDQSTKNVFDLNPATGEARPLLAENPKIYYADFHIDPNDSNWIVAVQEDHQASPEKEAENSLVVINVTTGEVKDLARGHDFYAFPRFSPNGKKLCWTQWDHPNMPWDKTELWIGNWHDGQVSNATCIAGQEVKSSITQPCWNSNGDLLFADDKSGYWQLYEFHNGTVRHIKLAGLEDAEFGYPDWAIGNSTYAPLSPERLVTCYNKNGRTTIIVVDIQNNTYRELGCPIIDIDFCPTVLTAIDFNTVVVVGSTATSPQLVTLVDINQGGLGEVLKRSISSAVPEEYVSERTSITFPRIYGPGGGEAHGLFLPPKNLLYAGPDGTLPPLIVIAHGGPTGQAGSGFKLGDQALTTRGYAVLQVDYVGSTGYGRAYKELLKGQWGISDIADTVSGVEYLAGKGLIDRKRVALTGHSAGGFVTMQGMALYPDVWATAVSLSGVSDLRLLLKETHKFEKSYLYALCCNPETPAEDITPILKDRSPITRADRITKPILCINGSEDPIVPQNQANEFVKTIQEAGGTAEVVIYDGEGHMFSKGSSLVDIEARRYAWFKKYLVDAHE